MYPFLMHILWYDSYRFAVSLFLCQLKMECYYLAGRLNRTVSSDENRKIFFNVKRKLCAGVLAYICLWRLWLEIHICNKKPFEWNPDDCLRRCGANNKEKFSHQKNANSEQRQPFLFMWTADYQTKGYQLTMIYQMTKTTNASPENATLLRFSPATNGDKLCFFCCCSSLFKCDNIKFIFYLKLASSTTVCHFTLNSKSTRLPLNLFPTLPTNWMPPIFYLKG